MLFALNAGGTLTFIQHFAQAAHNSSVATQELLWGTFQVAFCDAPLRYTLDLLCWVESMVYLQQVSQHNIAYGGWESEDEKRRKSEGGTTFFCLKIAYIEWVTQRHWDEDTSPLRVRGDRQGGRGRIRGGCSCTLQASLLTGHCFEGLRVAHCFIPI